MKQCIVLLFLSLCVAIGTISAQPDLSQTIRGTILDADSKTPLPGVQVILFVEPQRGLATDIDGNFRFEQVPVGRVTLQLSLLGYETLKLPNIVVNSGKEVSLNLEMVESASRLKEVTISANQPKGDAILEMALLSARSISAEETNRYAGGFNDPSRILSNFAGVTNTQDGSNDIIVRGNSPKYVQWRIEGEQITTPNHFGDQSAVGGSVSILNNNLLSNSDFMTGAFAPEFGDALSGVYNLRLRSGNNERTECIFGLGLLGTEMTIEGPLSKRTKASYLMNYRYSTAGLLSRMGLLGNLNGVLNFQDATFKVVFPSQKAGLFTVYGLGGISNFGFKDVTPALWVTPGDNATLRETRNDFDKKARLLNLGLKHLVNLTQKSYLTHTVAWSDQRIDDDIYTARVMRYYDDQGTFIRDSVLDNRIDFQSRLNRPALRLASTYHLKLNAQHKLQIGAKYTGFFYNFTQERYAEPGSGLVPLLDFSEHIGTVRAFAAWKYRPNEKLAIVSGVHSMYVALNQKSALEPRLALEYQATKVCKATIGYGRHSTMESIHHYFTQIPDAQGLLSRPNQDLGLLKADHVVAGLERRMGNQLRTKVEVYYQRLFDLPVENNDTSYFSTIVEGLDFKYLPLVNAGKGRNYGVELTVEKFFSEQWYLLANGSLFESKYTPLDGKERNTPFNSRYLVNLLFGKEFSHLGKKKNQTLGVNVKAYFTGGRRIIPLLRDAHGNLVVEPSQNRYYDYSKAFEAKLDDPYQIQCSFSYKWQKQKATHELFLNLDNLTNQKRRIMEYYDETEPGKVGYMRQFGFFPNLMFRVYF